MKHEDNNVAGASSSMASDATARREQDAPTTVAGASSSRASDAAAKREQNAPTTFPETPLWEYFNPRSEIDIRAGGNLPHWEQGNVWYFVTFRLADALPASVVLELKQQRAYWKQTHNLEALTAEELEEYHKLFSERYEKLLHAGGGACLLRESANTQIVAGALRFFNDQRYQLDETIIMPNHVHVLVKPLKDNRLVDILHSWKSFTANQINRRTKQSGQLWQHESYDHIVRHENAMHAIRRYIREN